MCSVKRQKILVFKNWKPLYWKEYVDTESMLKDFLDGNVEEYTTDMNDDWEIILKITYKWKNILPLKKKDKIVFKKFNNIDKTKLIKWIYKENKEKWKYLEWLLKDINSGMEEKNKILMNKIWDYYQRK